MQFRHGDLLLVPVREIPPAAERAGDKILAYGEATGHKHQLLGNAIIFRETEQQFVEIVEPAKLIHEEHNEIELPVGLYQVIRQREFGPYDRVIRSVQD
ncbi:MAG: hypothetical protein ACYDHX_07985 [Methanothrix sp.]